MGFFSFSSIIILITVKNYIPNNKIICYPFSNALLMTMALFLLCFQYSIQAVCIYNYLNDDGSLYN